MSRRTTESSLDRSICLLMRVLNYLLLLLLLSRLGGISVVDLGEEDVSSQSLSLNLLILLFLGKQTDC
jgi:hypothetical protein